MRTFYNSNLIKFWYLIWSILKWNIRSNISLYYHNIRSTVQYFCYLLIILTGLNFGIYPYFCESVEVLASLDNGQSLILMFFGDYVVLTKGSFTLLSTFLEVNSNGVEEWSLIVKSSQWFKLIGLLNFKVVSRSITFVYLDLCIVFYETERIYFKSDLS